MRKGRPRTLPAALLLAGLTMMGQAVVPAQAKAGFGGFPPGGQPVNVSVAFNTQLPLPDLEQETLDQAQRAGRQYLYRLGQEECGLLKETIAKSCRLTNLNINTQIQRHNQAQPMLYINGSASFSITLKDEVLEETAAPAE